MNSSSIQTSSDKLELLISTGQPYNEPFVGNRQDVLGTPARFQRGETGLLEPSAAFERR